MGQVAGTVVDIRGGQAVVECRADTAGCALCRGGRGCTWQRVVGKQSLLVPAAQSTATLQRGDQVTLEVDDGHLLAAAARLYLPPLAGLLLGPALLRAAQLDAGMASLVAAVAGLAAGLLVARLWADRAPAIQVSLQQDAAARDLPG
jgi:positive regulator of sigma E activity